MKNQTAVSEGQKEKRVDNKGYIEHIMRCRLVLPTYMRKREVKTE